MPELTNKLALGTANFGLIYGINNTHGHLTEGNAHEILQFALSSGITTVDTAQGYGNSEEVIGNFRSSSLEIVTKLGQIPAGVKHVPKYIQDQMNDSLRRLNKTQIHGLLLHSPDQLNGPMGSQIINTLSFLKTSGQVQKVGISIYSTETLNNIWNLFLPDIVQAPFNIFDQRLLHSGWVAKLLSQNVKIHLRSTFLQGLLSKPMNTLPTKFSKWRQIFIEFEEWQKRTGMSRTELALKFSLQQPWANKVIVGVDSPRQLSNLIKVSDSNMPDLPTSLANGIDDDLLINPTNWDDL